MASRSGHLLKDFRHIKPTVSRQDVNAVTRQLRECAARCPVSADLADDFFFLFYFCPASGATIVAAAGFIIHSPPPRHTPLHPCGRLP
ncbi:TPA: hypothetical protein ACN02O_000838, partial [Klebsiella oxytoca]